MTDHLFRESEPGHVKHTAATKALVQMPMLVPWSLMGMTEVGPAKMHVSFMRRKVSRKPDSDLAYSWSMRLQSGQSPKSLSTRYVLYSPLRHKSTFL